MNALKSIILFSSFLYLASCQDATPSNAQGSVNKELQVDEYRQKLEATKDAQLVDVRTPEEYDEGHLKDAVDIDYNSDDFSKRIARLDKTRPVFVYCLSGGRSAMAAEQMHNMGFREVYNMKGGMMKWNKAAMPVVKGSDSKKQTGMTMEAFNKMITGAEYVLVDYHAKWCAPCKEMLPILESLAEKKKGKLILLKIDADENKELMQEKEISGIPYLELYHNGNLAWKHEGFIDEQTLLKETKL